MYDNKMGFEKVGLLVISFFVCSWQNANSHMAVPSAAKRSAWGFEKVAPSVKKTAYVSGRFLYAPNGERVILRGINEMSVVSDPTGEKTLPQIAKTGANVVRLMWMRWGGGGAKLDILLKNCIATKMLPMLELHDATGKWEKLDSCVAFWLQSDVTAVLKKYERFLLLNIANECGDGTVTQAAFSEKYALVIKRLRAASINVPLVIDAANWGRNETYLLENAAQLLKADPSHNLIFSWHIWDAGIAESRIQSAIDRSIVQDICLLIGEFAPMEVQCKCCIPYKFILAYAQQKSIGWLAWSWGPGNADCAQMDMTKTTAFATLFDWGLEVAVTDSNSIKNTAVRPKIF
jgi:mannan endo-1,4-beta-mannosidase